MKNPDKRVRIESLGQVSAVSGDGQTPPAKEVKNLEEVNSLPVYVTACLYGGL